MSKKKLILALTLFLVSFLFCLNIQRSSAIDATSVYVNGIKADVVPHTEAGIIYLPVQSLATMLGISIQYNPKLNTIKINEKMVAVTPLKKDSKLYLPVESIVQAAGGVVEWDGLNKSLKITTNKKNQNTASGAEPSEVITPKPVKTTDTNSTPASAGNIPQELITAYTPGEAGKSNEPFCPRSASNGIFLVTVTNIEDVNVIKNYYKPKAGHKFIIIYLSQQNISGDLQTYTGKFYLMDSRKRTYSFIEGLSNYWLIILRPGGSNFGYLVFEISEDAGPAQLILQTVNQSPLSLNLI